MTIDATAAQPGWPALFWEAFRASRNAMVLLDDQRRHVEVNGAYLQLLGYPRSFLVGRPVYDLVVDGPLASSGEWRASLSQKQFAGVAPLVRSDGGLVTVEYAGHPEIVTGQQLVLVVALRTSRANRRLPDAAQPARPESLTKREHEVIGLITLGLTGPEIAEELQLAHNTVRTHVHNAMAKVGARSRAQLVAKSLGDGVTPVQGQ